MLMHEPYSVKEMPWYFMIQDRVKICLFLCVEICCRNGKYKE